jgi:hypothetical protein
MGLRALAIIRLKCTFRHWLSSWARRRTYRSNLRRFYYSRALPASCPRHAEKVDWQRMAPPHIGKSIASVPYVARGHALPKMDAYISSLPLTIMSFTLNSTDR